MSSGKKVVILDQKKRTVTIGPVTLDNDLVFSFLDSKPEKEREEIVIKAFNIGIIALYEDRLSAFLAKTANTLGTELERLKYLYDLQQQVFYRTAVKGKEIEQDLTDILQAYIKSKGYKDIVKHTGESVGELPNNKTGDFLVLINGFEDLKIVFESKFDKAKKLGEFLSTDPFVKKETAFSQLLEAGVNRGASQSVIVFDYSISDPKLVEKVENTRYYPGIGFVCLVDYERGNFTNLFLCYEIARSMVLAAQNDDTQAVLTWLVSRFLVDIDFLLGIKKQLLAARDSLAQIWKSVVKGSLSLEFTKEIFNKFLVQGRLTRSDLLELYQSDSIREKYKELEKVLVEEFSLENSSE